MRGLLVLAAIVVLFVLVGWLTFSNEPGRTSINIETQEIRDDTKEAVDSGAKLLHKAGDELERNADATTEHRDAAPVR